MTNKEIKNVVVECLSPFYSIRSVDITDHFDTIKDNHKSVSVWLNNGDEVLPELLDEFECKEHYDENQIKALAYSIAEVHVVTEKLNEQ